MKSILLMYTIIILAYPKSVLAKEESAMITPIYREKLYTKYQKYSLSDHQINSFEKDGYLIVNKLLNDKSLNLLDKSSAEVLNEVKQEIKDKKIKNLDNLRIDYKGSSVMLGENNKGKAVIKLISWVGSAKSDFLDIGQSEQLLVPLAQLLGTYELDHIINQLHPKEKNDGMVFEIHQDYENRISFDPDWEDINGRGSFVQMLIAIDENTEDNGPLKIIPMVKNEKLYNFNLMTYDEKQKTLQKLIMERGIKEPVTITLKPGDAILFHPMLIHFSEPNNSMKNRRVFINSCSYPGANKKSYPGKGSGQRVILENE